MVNTHHHFDHCFGNAVLADARRPRPIWAHHDGRGHACASDGERCGGSGTEEYRTSDPELAAEARGGGRICGHPTGRSCTRSPRWTSAAGRVELRHLGRGHTDGDLVVHVPDADVLVAGDLVEEGAPPSFDDSYPLEWPDTVAALLQLLAGPRRGPRARRTGRRGLRRGPSTTS